MHCRHEPSFPTTPLSRTGNFLLSHLSHDADRDGGVTQLPSNNCDQQSQATGQLSVMTTALELFACSVALDIFTDGVRCCIASITILQQLGFCSLARYLSPAHLNETIDCRLALACPTTSVRKKESLFAQECCCFGATTYPISTTHLALCKCGVVPIVTPRRD